MRLAGLLLLTIAAAGCQSEQPDNFLAPQGNALNQAQVDAALGPESSSVEEPAMAADGTAPDTGGSGPSETSPPERLNPPEPAAESEPPENSSSEE